MQMHLIISVLFIITVFFAFLEDRLKDIHKISILVAYAIIMVLIATTKSIDENADGATYERLFYNNSNTLVELATEPTYIYLSRIVLACGGTIVAMFFIYAMISIPAKLRVLYAMTPYIFTALVIYIPVYYELHDLVQIRAAAASTFLLSAVYFLSHQRVKIAAAFIVIATLFHYSSLVFLPFLFIRNRRLGQIGRIILGCSILAFFGLYLAGKDLFQLIPAGSISGKVTEYQKTSEKGMWDMALLYKNAYYMVKFILFFVCLYYYDYLVEKTKTAPIFINLLAASLLAPMLFSSIPVIASRLGDLFGIIDGVVFTYVLYLVSPRYLARACITIVGLYMLIYNMIVSEYFV
jgi:hypothetical protein